MGIREAVGGVGVIVALYESWKVAVGAGTALPLEEDGKQKRLHLSFRHLPRGSIVESR